MKYDKKGLENALVKAIAEKKKIDGELAIRVFFCVDMMTRPDLENLCKPFIFELEDYCGEDENTNESLYIFTGPLKNYDGLYAVAVNNTKITFIGLGKTDRASHEYYTTGHGDTAIVLLLQESLVGPKYHLQDVLDQLGMRDLKKRVKIYK